MTSRIHSLVMQMSDIELGLWFEMGGDIPDNHPMLFKLRDRLRRTAQANGTRPAFPPVPCLEMEVYAASDKRKEA